MSDILPPADCTTMTEVRAGVDDVERLVSATTELVANVVDHAHLGGRPAPFRVRARLEGSGHLVVDVVGYYR